MVWGCFCVKVWAMVTFLLINLGAKTLIQNRALSASLVRAEFVFWNRQSGSGLVPTVFSLGLRPAVSSSLLIITHSSCLSMQGAFLWVVKYSDLQERAPCGISNTDLQKKLPFISNKTWLYFYFLQLWIFFVSFRHLFTHNWLWSFSISRLRVKHLHMGS